MNAGSIAAKVNEHKNGVILLFKKEILLDFLILSGVY